MADLWQKKLKKWQKYVNGKEIDTFVVKTVL
jgi:hypothetical protein